MLNVVLLVFAVAAVGGLVLAASVLRGRLAPWALSIVHALLGATGLVLLLVLAWRGVHSPHATIALGLFVIAALIGFFLASLHLRKETAPKNVVLIHAGIAIAGFLTLLSAVWVA